MVPPLMLHHSAATFLWLGGSPPPLYRSPATLNLGNGARRIGQQSSIQRGGIATVTPLDDPIEELLLFSGRLLSRGRGFSGLLAPPSSAAQERSSAPCGQESNERIHAAHGVANDP